MSSPIRYLIADGITPEEEIARAAALLSGIVPGDGSPLLMISGLLGDGLALGRYQRAETALTGAYSGSVHRRLTGGRTCRYGGGQVSICLIVPDLFALSGARTFDKTINRGVRGLLRTLTALVGLPALYGGRDVATITRQPVAMVSMDALDNGVCLFQAVVGLDQSVVPSAEWLTTAPVTGIDGAVSAPLTGWLEGLTFDPLAEALVTGYGTATGRDMTPFGDIPPTSAMEMESAPWEGSGNYLWSAPATIPIGMLEAGVSVTDGVISGMRLCGDFIVATRQMARLESALVGISVDSLAVGQALDGVFSGGGGILGITRLASLRDVVLDAAGGI